MEKTKETIQGKYKVEEHELQSIMFEIENYTHFVSYEYIFPKKKSTEDESIYENLLKNRWLKPEHLDIKVANGYEFSLEYLNLGVEYIKKAGSSQTPAEKERMFLSLYRLSVYLAAYLYAKKDVGADEVIPILFLFLLRSYPKKLRSMINYIMQFPQQEKGELEYCIKVINSAIVFFNGLTPDKLKIDPKEYSENIQREEDNILKMKQRMRSVAVSSDQEIDSNQ